MRRFHVEVDGGKLSGIAFGDPVRPADAVFLHANGFNAMTYQSILAPLGHRAHVAAVDLRGHGRSTAPAIPSKHRGWNIYRDDIIKALEQLSPNGTVLAGHSMGATTALLVAAKRPDLVTGLVLVDPVLLPPATYRWSHFPGVPGIMKSTSAMAKGAKKRRREFPSMEEALKSFIGRGAFKTWRAPFLEDYLTDGLVQDNENEAFHLSCEPAWEAANFGGQRHRPWGAVKKLKCPVILIRAEKNSTCGASSSARILRAKPLTVLLEPTGTSHFIPMERPYVVRDAISEFLARYVEGFQRGDEGRVQRNLDSSIGQKD